MRNRTEAHARIQLSQCNTAAQPSKDRINPTQLKYAQITSIARKLEMPQANLFSLSIKSCLFASPMKGNLSTDKDQKKKRIRTTFCTWWLPCTAVSQSCTSEVSSVTKASHRLRATKAYILRATKAYMDAATPLHARRCQQQRHTWTQGPPCKEACYKHIHKTYAHLGVHRRSLSNNHT